MEECSLKRDEVGNRSVRLVLKSIDTGIGKPVKKGSLYNGHTEPVPTLSFLTFLAYDMPKKVRKEIVTDFWTSKVNFYLDGVRFYYKSNPEGQARAPQGRI